MKLKGKIIVIILLTLLVFFIICIFLLRRSVPASDGTYLIQSPISDTEATVSKNKDIVFVLDKVYKTGEKIEIRIKNVSDVSYINTALQAPCALTYINSQGKGFYPPEAISCDLLSSEEIRPNEIVREFGLSLKKCVRQEGWKCYESQSLAPGEYTLRAVFPSKDRVTNVLAEAKIIVVE